MSARIWFASLVLAPAAISFLQATPPRSATPALAVAAAPGVQVPGPAATTTTLDDQAELAVTVYNSDIALVRDVRNIQLSAGELDLRFMDIAATVNPATVH